MVKFFDIPKKYETNTNELFDCLDCYWHVRDKQVIFSPNIAKLITGDYDIEENVFNSSIFDNGEYTAITGKKRILIFRADMEITHETELPNKASQ